MENQQNQFPLFSLQLNEVSKNHLLTVAQWAIIVAIVSIVSSLLSIIETVTARPQMVEMEGFSYQVEQSATAGGIVGGIISLLISFLLCYFLYMFGKHTKKGLETIDQGQINSGFNNLKTYFQITGILLIIGIVFIVIAILGVAAYQSSTQ